MLRHHDSLNVEGDGSSRRKDNLALCLEPSNSGGMFQISFTDVSSAEMAELPKLLQIEILSEFQVLTPDFVNAHPDRFGKLVKGERQIYRYRAKDYRIYFEKADDGLRVHRVLHRNTMKDFLFRSNLESGEDELLQDHPGFWSLIDDPQRQRSNEGQ